MEQIHPAALYLPLGLDGLGEQLHVLELGRGAEGFHALSSPEEALQQVWVQSPQGLLGETTDCFNEPLTKRSQCSTAIGIMSSQL